MRVGKLGRLTISKGIFAGLVLGLFLGGAEAQNYARIFDGVSLKGWHATGEGVGVWSVKDSALIGTMPAGRAESYLISDFNAKNFSLRLKLWWVRGNSGINFRNIQQGSLANGIQVDIEGANTTGNLYDNVKAAYVARSDSTAKWFKPNAWNDILLEAEGARIVVYLNGKKTVDFQDVGGRTDGVFAFQLHAGQAMELRFKDIEYWDHAVVSTLSRPKFKEMRPIRGSSWIFRGWRIDGVKVD